MIVNPGKFQAIILDKKKTNHTQEKIKIGNNAVQVKSSVKLLGVQIDAELNVNLHIANICRSATNQLDALIRLRKLLGFEDKKVLIISYFYSNFNYCPLVDVFPSKVPKESRDFTEKGHFAFTRMTTILRWR